MAMDGLPEGVPPSGRVPGQLLLAAPILKRRRRRYREENGNSRSILGVSSACTKYRQRGHQGGPQVSQEGAWCAPGGVPGTLLGLWWVPSLPSVVLQKAFGMLIFYIFFPEFI